MWGGQSWPQPPLRRLVAQLCENFPISRHHLVDAALQKAPPSLGDFSSPPRSWVVATRWPGPLKGFTTYRASGLLGSVRSSAASVVEREEPPQKAAAARIGRPT